MFFPSMPPVGQNLMSGSGAATDFSHAVHHDGTPRVSTADARTSLAVILALSMAYVQSTQGIISISVGRTSPPCWGYFCPSPAPLLSISSAPCRLSIAGRECTTYRRA